MALRRRVVHSSASVELACVSCDGVDAPRPAVEPTARDHLVVVLRGAFELRGRDRLVADPSRALVLRQGTEHVFRHPNGGGDLCLSIGGALARRLAEDGPTMRPLSARDWSRLRHLAMRGGDDDLSVEEALHTALAGTGRAPRPRAERALADEIADHVRRRLEGRLTLAELARVTGYSEFHLCRVFRRATGVTIGAFSRELRLRHALALILDGERPLAEIASEVGFASQAHLTTQFRARFGVTPRRARLAGAL